MKRLHLVCNAHLDPIWQWTWDEGIAAAISTFKSAADLADQFDYIFCHNESLLYEAIEQYAPALFERIRKLVKEGKWHIMGGWYLQPDCNMPCGESFVRQIKVGQAYFKEKFGVTPTVATNFDPFGHSVGLAQILKKCGYSGYIIMRPWRFQFGKDLGKFFHWKSPDGSVVTVMRAPNYGSHLGDAARKISEFAETMRDVDCILWGVGNHGGGPSRKDLADIAALNIPDVQIMHSTPENVFADAIRITDTVEESLAPSMPGCYTSMMRVKQAHRRAENLFYEAEKLLAASSLAGYIADTQMMEKAQKKMLLAEFHDILPGSCVEEGEREGLELLSFTQTTAKEYRTAAFQYLAMRNEPAKEGEYPIFVFNTRPYETTMPIEAEFSLADQNYSDDTRFVPIVYDEYGNVLPSQQIKEASTLNVDWRKKIVFEGKLKPMGLTRFSVYTKPLPIEKKNAEKKTLADCLAAQSLLRAPLSLKLYEDTADPWGMSNAELVALGHSPVSFRKMTKKEIKSFCGIPEKLPFEHIIEDGDLLTSVEQFWTAGHTNAALSYRFYRNQPYIDVHVTLEFADKNHLVRLCVPVPEGEAIGDGPYVVEKKKSCEVTFQKWLGVDEGDKVFSVINNGIYGGKIGNGMMELTLVRGSGHCFHPIRDRQLYPYDRYLPRIDCGRYEYSFRIYRGNLNDVCVMAESFQTPPYAINAFPIGGGSDQKPAVIRTDKAVCMPVCRMTEGGLLMRFYNPEKQPLAFRLFVGDDSTDVSVGKGEVLSVVYQNGAFTLHHDDMPL